MKTLVDGNEPARSRAKDRIFTATLIAAMVSGEKVLVSSCRTAALLWKEATPNGLLSLDLREGSLMGAHTMLLMGSPLSRYHFSFVTSLLYLVSRVSKARPARPSCSANSDVQSSFFPCK